MAIAVPLEYVVAVVPAYPRVHVEIAEPLTVKT